MDDKKIKLDDLSRISEKPLLEEKTTSVTRVSLDKLENQSSPPPVPQKSVSITASKPQPKSRPVSKNVEVQKIEITPLPNKVYFPLHVTKSLCFKALSLLLIILCVEALSHLLNLVEGKSLFDFSELKPILLSGDKKWILPKLGIFILITYFSTPHEDVVLDSKGVYCRKISSDLIHIRWDEIRSARHEFRLLEPYLFLYGGEKNEVLGQIPFSLRSPQDFFKFVERHAGKDHPLRKI